jgi:hypothetical protein
MPVILDNDGRRHNTGLDKFESVVETLTELIKVLFVEEHLVFFEIDLAGVVVEQLAALSDSNKLVTSTGFFHIEEISTFAGRDGLAVKFFFSLLFVVHTRIFITLKFGCKNKYFFINGRLPSEKSFQQPLETPFLQGLLIVKKPITGGLNLTPKMEILFISQNTV